MTCIHWIRGLKRMGSYFDQFYEKIEVK